MLVLTLLFLAQIAVLRLRLLARTAREQRVRDVWQPLLAAEIAGEDIALPPLAAGDRDSLLRLWNHLQESLRGATRERLNTVAKRTGLAQYAHALLRKNALRPQLLALTTLGNLRDATAWDAIARLAQVTDPLLSLAAVRAMFQIDPATAVHELRALFIERDDWSVAQLAILLEEAGSAISYSELAAAALHLAVSDAPREHAQLNRLLHLLEAAPSREVTPTARTVLALSSDSEVIAQCLTFLHEPSDLPLACQYLGHPIWFVRLQAAHALSRVGSANDAPRLVALLSDPVWWVRYRAAQALIALLRGDAQALAKVRAGLVDRYAEDMLNMAMTEQRLK